MKYPNVIFYRYDKYADIDAFINQNISKFNCNINITNDCKYLNNLYDPNFQILVTFGTVDNEYNHEIFINFDNKFSKKWIHVKNIDNIDQFNYSVNYCFIHNVIKDRTLNRPVFSIFTTCYNSYEKINRAMNSILKQTFIDWEWIILDDSPSDEHFVYLKNNLSDKRIRLYKRSTNSGNIGNVKNEAIMLCRGSLILEMDHDDEILPDVLMDANRAFVENPEVGFVYMDFTNIQEDGTNYSYEKDVSNPRVGKGYADYYIQKINGKWNYVFCTPNINNITMKSLPSLPNHPRIWRKDLLFKIGNFSEHLPICDDLEVLLRTIINTKIIKIHKLGYIQYMNSGNNNFSLIRNSEINRIGPQFISPIFFNLFDVNNKMKQLDAFEDPIYDKLFVKLWKKNSNYTHKFCNKVVQYDYDKQFCILGFDALIHNIDNIKNLYSNIRHDFIVLDNTLSMIQLTTKLDDLSFSRMKCHTLNDVSYKEFTKYFLMVYKSCNDYEIIEM